MSLYDESIISNEQSIFDENIITNDKSMYDETIITNDKPMYDENMIIDDKPVIAKSLETDWWDDFMSKQYPNELCLKYFKCSRKTFMILISLLRPYIAPKTGPLGEDSHRIRKGICTEKQIAILMYKMTTGADYVSMSKKFKIHKTTIHKILYKVIVAINKYLLHDVITLPKAAEAEVIAKDFEIAHKIPQIIGVMTIVHIPIYSPINLNYKFLNTKFYTSFVVQNVIDANCLFRDVSVRHAGAVDMKSVVEDSNIYKYAQKVIPSEKQNINGVDIPYKIVSPVSGPQDTWLLNDYDPVVSSEDAYFNKNLEDVRNYADSVIVRLRARFLILTHMMDLSYKVAPQVIAVCCIIHNICEREGDPFLEEWLTRYNQLSKKFPQPQMKEEWNMPSDEVLMERDALRDYICSDPTLDSNIL